MSLEFRSIWVWLDTGNHCENLSLRSSDYSNVNDHSFFSQFCNDTPYVGTSIPRCWSRQSWCSVMTSSTSKARCTFLNGGVWSCGPAFDPTWISMTSRHLASSVLITSWTIELISHRFNILSLRKLLSSEPMLFLGSNVDRCKSSAQVISLFPSETRSGVRMVNPWKSEAVRFLSRLNSNSTDQWNGLGSLIAQFESQQLIAIVGLNWSVFDTGKGFRKIWNQRQIISNFRRIKEMLASMLSSHLSSTRDRYFKSDDSHFCHGQCLRYGRDIPEDLVSATLEGSFGISSETYSGSCHRSTRTDIRVSQSRTLNAPSSVKGSPILDYVRSW